MILPSSLLKWPQLLRPLCATAKWWCSLPALASQVAQDLFLLDSFIPLVGSNLSPSFNLVGTRSYGVVKQERKEIRKFEWCMRFKHLVFNIFCLMCDCWQVNHFFLHFLTFNCDIFYKPLVLIVLILRTVHPVLFRFQCSLSRNVPT